MSVKGHETVCDGCGEVAKEKSKNGYSTPKLVGWIEGSTCTASPDVREHRFHTCSVNCLKRYAENRQQAGAA